MHTPNLDALASRSLLFEKAYDAQALCSPSRTSTLTSRRPDTTRITQLARYWRDYGGNFTTLPQVWEMIFDLVPCYFSAISKPQQGWTSCSFLRWHTSWTFLSIFKQWTMFSITENFWALLKALQAAWGWSILILTGVDSSKNCRQNSFFIFRNCSQKSGSAL